MFTVSLPPSLQDVDAETCHRGDSTEAAKGVRISKCIIELGMAVPLPTLRAAFLQASMYLRTHCAGCTVPRSAVWQPLSSMLRERDAAKISFEPTHAWRWADSEINVLRHSAAVPVRLLWRAGACVSC